MAANVNKAAALLAIGLVLTLASAAPAIVIKPTLDSYSDVVNVAGTSPPRLIDNAGLFDSTGASATVDTGDTLADAMAVLSEWDSNGHSTGWVGAHDPQVPTFVWDLGSDMQLGDLVLWKYGNKNGSPPHAAKDFELRFNTSAEGTATFTGPATAIVLDLPTTATQTVLPTNQVAQAPQAFDLGAVMARYVEMKVLTNHSGSAGSSVGFNEVRFNVVPEPTTVAVWSLLGLCWAGMGVWRRRGRHGIEMDAVPARQGWTHENRTAIRQMLDRQLAK